MSLVTKLAGLVAQVMPDRAPDALADAHLTIGRPFDRLDGAAKVTGAATFSAEYELDGLVHAALVHSTIAKGRILRIDATEALACAGVIEVLTHLNAPKMKDPPLTDGAGGGDNAGSSAPVLNTERIFWNGQPVAVVVADTLERAEHAASRVRVEYAGEPAAVSFDAAKPGAEKPKQVMGDDTDVVKGDAEAALAAAAFKVDQHYRTPRHNHNAIEPHATIAVWAGERLTVYEPTQYVRGVAASLQKMFSLDKDQVKVLSPYVGGGFGGKGSMWSHVQLCVLAARVVGRPVKLALTREGVFRLVGGRTPSEQRVALAADASGSLSALIHTGVTATSSTNDYPEQFSFPVRHLYAADNLLIGQRVVRLDTTPNTYMRAPGESIGSFALESAMDELSYALGIDPVELRLRNEPARDPAKGTEFSSRHLPQAFRLGAEKFGWSQRAREVGATRDGDWAIGQGVASAFYPVYRLPAAARVTLRSDGTALVQTSAQEMGMGTATAQTQHAAERLGLSMGKVRFEYGDSDLPPSNQAGGSSQTISVALAVQLACEKLHKDLLALARKDADSPLAGADIESVAARDEGLFRKEPGGAGSTYQAILQRADKGSLAAEAKTGPALETLKYSMGSYGAQFCEVRVNTVSGEVRVSRWVGAFDAGRIINPKLAHSQFAGGIIMGIGMALTEETFFDERAGRVMNPSLAEYHVPVNADVPAIETCWLDIPDPHTPIGAHGIGEIGITGAAAAIANAVYHATGKRIRELPITLDKLL